MIAIDFETYLSDDKVGMFPKPVCLSYHTGKDSGLLIGTDMEEYLYYLLENKLPIVAHNAMFEAGVIYTHFPKLREFMDMSRFQCTKIYEQLLDNVREKPGFRYSLADLVFKYFNEDISENKKDPLAWRLRYNELDGVPLTQWPEEAREYAINDSIWAFKVLQQQQKEGSMKTTESVEAEIWLNLMANVGMYIDQNRVQVLEEEIYNKLEPEYAALEKAGLCTRIPGVKRAKKNVKEFRNYVESIVSEPKQTAKGCTAISAEALNIYLAQTEDELLRSYLEIMKYEKVVSSFTSNLRSDIVRTRYSATKSTGRTSSSKLRDIHSVNIQQMPRKVEGVTWDVRNCFIPREGYTIVSIDYSGLELASTAHQLYKTFGHSSMRNVLNSGDIPTDMHSRLAAEIMSSDLQRKVTYEEFVANKKTSPYDQYRQLAKPINLGFPGGIGYDTMRTLLAMSEIVPKYTVLERNPNIKYLERLCRRLKREVNQYIRVQRLNKKEYALVYDELVKLKSDLFNLYPELAKFLTVKHNEFTTGETKWMKNEYDEFEEEPMYRYGIYGFERDYSTYTAFCNGYLMQTPSAVGAKRAMCAIIKKYLGSEYMNPLAFIHDEIVFEVKPDKMKEVVKDVSDIMITQMQTVLSSVRITVEAEAMDYWRKSGGYYSIEYWRNENGQKLYCR